MPKTCLDQVPQSTCPAPFVSKPVTWLDEFRLTKAVVPLGDFHAPAPKTGHSGENASLVITGEVSLVLQSGIEAILGPRRKEQEKGP